MESLIFLMDIVLADAVLVDTVEESLAGPNC